MATPISKEAVMDHEAQQAMDGSPARVTRTLIDMARGDAKFAGQTRAISTGASVLDEVIAIKFQAGPIGEVGVNGCSIEDVIDVLVARLGGFQRGGFRCRENALAITKLEEAKLWLLERTRQRQAQGVEGRNVAHIS